MLRRLESWPDWRIALLITVVLRIAVTLVAAAFSPFLHPDPVLVHSNALTDNLPAPGSLHYAFLGIWERFDTLWYLRIAEHGYDHPMGVVFYPLYPGTIRLFSLAMPWTVAALAAATTAAFFAFWGLLRLVGSGSPWRARIDTLLVLAAWPSSFVLFVGYAESLTLALIVWAVIFARSERWELGALCGILAGMSRPCGVLVVVPLAVLAWRSRRVRSLVVLLSPVGLMGYWGWLRWTGRPSVVEAYRQYMGTTLLTPWANLAEAVRLIVEHNQIMVIAKLALVVLAGYMSLRREVRLEDKLFAATLTLQMTLYTGTLLGGPRYVIPEYPAFIAMAAYTAKRWEPKEFGVYLTAFGFLNVVWMWSFLNWSLAF